MLRIQLKIPELFWTSILWKQVFIQDKADRIKRCATKVAAADAADDDEATFGACTFFPAWETWKTLALKPILVSVTKMLRRDLVKLDERDPEIIICPKYIHLSA